MSKPTIKIDLRDLTQAHLDECAPALGTCSNAAPCIIGTLMTRDERNYRLFASVVSLKKEGVLEIPDDQYVDAIAMQAAFDQSRWDDLVAIADKYIKKEVA
jgi:hypothetical protein